MIIIMITYRDSGFRPCKETLPWISQHIATHHRIFHLLACLDIVQMFEAILKTHETLVAPLAHLDKPSSAQQRIWSFFFSSEGLVCVLHFLRLEIHLWNHLSFFLLHSLSQSRDLSQVWVHLRQLPFSPDPHLLRAGPPRKKYISLLIIWITFAKYVPYYWNWSWYVYHRKSKMAQVLSNIYNLLK